MVVRRGSSARAPRRASCGGVGGYRLDRGDMPLEHQKSCGRVGRGVGGIEAGHGGDMEAMRRRGGVVVWWGSVGAGSGGRQGNVVECSERWKVGEGNGRSLKVLDGGGR